MASKYPLRDRLYICSPPPIKSFFLFYVQFFSPPVPSRPLSWLKHTEGDLFLLSGKTDGKKVGWEGRRVQSDDCVLQPRRQALWIRGGFTILTRNVRFLLFSAEISHKYFNKNVLLFSSDLSLVNIWNM